MQHQNQELRKPLKLAMAVIVAAVIVKLPLIVSGAEALLGPTPAFLGTDLAFWGRFAPLVALWAWGRGLIYFWRLRKEPLRAIDPSREGPQRTRDAIARIERLALQRDWVLAVILLVGFGLALQTPTSVSAISCSLIAAIASSDLVQLYDRRAIYDRFAVAAFESFQALLPGNRSG